MNKLYVLLMFTALVAYVACQRQQMEEQAQEEHQVTQDEAKPNRREKAPETLLTPASSASPSASREKRYRLESQAQKFQPRRIVPMASPIRETPTPIPTSSEPPTQRVNKKQTEK